MMNIRIDDRYAYIEIEVFGQYQPERFDEVIAAMRGLAERHGAFSELEIHHGKPGNFWSMFKRVSGAGNAGEDFAFMKKMRKYALVSDDPPFILRMAVMFTRSAPFKMRLFKMHERDMARQWIEERGIEERGVETGAQAHGSVPPSS